MITKPNDIVYDVHDKPSLRLSLLLAIQHLIVLSGTVVYPLVIIRHVGGSEAMAISMISFSMLASGLASVLLALNHRVIGSGYLLPQSVSAAFIQPSILAADIRGLPLVFGMTMFAGLLQFFFSRIVQRLHKLFPTEISGLVIVMVGFSLVPTATSQFMGIDKLDQVSTLEEVSVAILTAATILGIYVWGNQKIKIFSVILGLAVGYVSSYLLGVIDNSHLEKIFSGEHFVAPKPSLEGWHFDLEMMIPFAIAALAVSLKGTGDIIAYQKISNKNWVRPNMKIVSRGLLASSIGTTIAGVFGGLGQATVSSNIGFAAASGILSRKIGIYVGGIMMFGAFFPRVIKFLIVMPKPVMGAILIFLIAFIIITGIQIITSRMIDTRKAFIIGVPMLFGLSVDMVPGLYDHIHPYLKPVFSSSLSLATILAIVMNMLFRIGIYRRHVITLTRGQADANEQIIEAMQGQGALWGARQETVHKASAAMIEFMDSAQGLQLTNETFRMHVAYDELSLKVEILYRGQMIPFVDQKPTSEELIEDEQAYMKLAGFMLNHYADRVRYHSIGGFCRIGLYFDN